MVRIQKAFDRADYDLKVHGGLSSPLLAVQAPGQRTAGNTSCYYRDRENPLASSSREGYFASGIVVAVTRAEVRLLSGIYDV